MAPRSDASVLTTFSSNGWSSPVVASLVGISAAIGDVIGADSSVHLAEELKNASWILPRSMIATAMMNYVLGFITISMAVQLDFINPGLTDSHYSYTGVLSRQPGQRNQVPNGSTIRRSSPQCYAITRRYNHSDNRNAFPTDLLRREHCHNQFKAAVVLRS